MLLMKVLVVLLSVAIPTSFCVRGTIISKKNSLLTVERFNSEEELDELEEHSLVFQVNERHDVYEQGETKDFLHFLAEIRYDRRQCPKPNAHGPVVINVSVVVSSIRAVSEGTMDFNIEMFYREYWTDSRLTYSNDVFKNKSEISLHESYTNFLWHPDTFMPNSIASKNPREQSFTHRSLLRKVFDSYRLRNDGRVLYSRRLSLIVTCGMDLTLFPFDSQLCKLGIESYGYTAEYVRYSWSRESITALTLQEIRLPDFKVMEAFVTSRLENYATGNYSRLHVCFVFSRAAGFCFLQLIIPSTAVVITSWVSLWMENETSFQDMISIILTITFLLFSYNEVMPRVSYIKAMDVYLGVCFCIVFFSLIKLAMVKYMKQRLRLTKDTSIVAGMLPSMRREDVCSTISSTTGKQELLATKECRNFGRPTVLAISGGEHVRYKTLYFTPQFMKRFHWISQISFFFGFFIFCLFYFLLYPNIYAQLVDEDCERTSSEWFADIP